MGTIAGQTNFDLDETSGFSYSEKDAIDCLASISERKRGMGVDEKTIQFYEDQFLI